LNCCSDADSGYAQKKLFSSALAVDQKIPTGLVYKKKNISATAPGTGAKTKG
jgi:hypothetical protein